jgi:predicted alpha/beta hydrolase family esterase
MWNRSFLILHGVENRRPAGHWQHELVMDLRERGEQVFYPQLPDTESPTLKAWTEAIRAELALMRGERVVVCHSLASVAWMHVAANADAKAGFPAADSSYALAPSDRSDTVGGSNALAASDGSDTAALRAAAPADRVLLVSPPGPAAFRWDVIAEFTSVGLDLENLKLAYDSVRLACSDDDPYCVEGAAEHYGLPLGCEVDVIPGAGHIALDDGYGRWPSVLEWCLDPTVRLAPNR